MSKHSQWLAVVALCTAAASVAAQVAEGCEYAPGFAFGITAINCSTCEFRSDRAGIKTMTFFGEPVVLETRAGSPVVVGDIVEAVNGRPITTAAGADQFVYPSVGSNEIKVRRGRDEHVLAATVPASMVCDRSAHATRVARDSMVAKLRALLAQLDTTRRRMLPSAISNDSARAVLTALNDYLDSSSISRNTAMYLKDGVFSSDPYFDIGNTSSNGAGGYGFAVACAPSCTPATGTEGVTSFPYYKYSGTPPIIAVRSDSPADKAGVKVGDVITKVDGVSILDDAAARQLWSVHRKNELRLTVIHDKKEVTYLIKTP